DAHRDDPIGDCLLEEADYAALAALARGLGAPVGAVLEGGYDLGALAGSVAATMEALANGAAPPSAGASALVERARAQVGRYWELCAGSAGLRLLAVDELREGAGVGAPEAAGGVLGLRAGAVDAREDDVEPLLEARVVV